MKIKKRLCAFFLAVIAVLTFSTQVWAAELESSIATDPSDDSVVISPRVTCTVCKVGFLIMVCDKKRYWDDVREHYSWGKRCLVNYFTSSGHYLCVDCGATRPFDYVDEFGDEHLCVENHSSCGLGDMSICSLNAPLPPMNEE